MRGETVLTVVRNDWPLEGTDVHIRNMIQSETSLGIGASKFAVLVESCLTRFSMGFDVCGQTSKVLPDLIWDGGLQAWNNELPIESLLWFRDRLVDNWQAVLSHFGEPRFLDTSDIHAENILLLKRVQRDSHNFRLLLFDFLQID